jgi:hypothetical protein
MFQSNLPPASWLGEDQLYYRHGIVQCEPQNLRPNLSLSLTPLCDLQKPFSYDNALPTSSAKHFSEQSPYEHYIFD